MFVCNYIYSYIFRHEIYQYIHKMEQCNLLDRMVCARHCVLNMYTLYVYGSSTLAIAIRVLLLNPLNFSSAFTSLLSVTFTHHAPFSSFISFLRKYIHNSLFRYYYNRHCRILMLNDLAFSSCTHFKWPCS